MINAILVQSAPHHLLLDNFPCSIWDEGFKDDDKKARFKDAELEEMRDLQRGFRSPKTSTFGWIEFHQRACG